MLSAAQTDLKEPQPTVAKRGKSRLPKINKTSGEQSSLVEDVGALPSQGQPPEATLPKRKRGRPSKAELAARAAAEPSSQTEGKKERKLPERLTEEERIERYFRVSLEFPHPTVFSPKQALERFPELAYLQNAYGFLKSAAKRGFVENLGNGQFQFMASATADLKNSFGHPPAQADVASDASPKPRPTISLRKAEEPSPPPKTVSKPEPTPVATAAPATAPVPAPEVAARRVPPQSPAPIARSAREPMAPQSPRNDEDKLRTLLQLSRRFRSDRYYNLDDFIVPLSECRAAVYGDVEVGTDEPSVCVVVAAYEPDPKAVNPNDIDVLFLDVRGQAHIRSAASWQFLPYRK